jgi:translocation and assembly module TamB
MRVLRSALFGLALAVLPQAGAAQSDDRGYLQALLEDSLSGAGRKVTITGFAGALSSRATIQELTIADGEGVWLTLQGVELDWTRSALLRGRLEVSALSATSITVARAPVAETAGLPAAEAQGFSLPELPVSVQIGRIATPRIELGAALLGETVTARLEGALTLAGGEGRGTLDLERTDDAPDTRIDLMASFANASRRLVVDLTAEEQAGGLIGRKIRLPGQPDFRLTVKGDGIVDAYAARLRLETAGVERLAGRLTLDRQGDGAFGFAADLGGNVVPLFAPAYAEFFGTDVRLVADGTRAADGRLDLRQMQVATDALDLSGSLVLAADGLPERFALNGTMAQDDGSAVLLPLPGAVQTRLDRAELSLSFDAAVSPDWTAQAAVTGLDRADLAARTLRLDGTGRIGRDATGRTADGILRFAADGIEPADPNLARALGPAVSGLLGALWEEDAGVVKIDRIELRGEGYSLLASGTVDDLSQAFHVSGASAEAQVADLSRLAGLVGRPLAGAGTVRLTGQGSPLAGNFDIEAEVAGQDLRIGQAEADSLLRGPSRLALSALRDASGTTIRSLQVAASSLRATASGRIASSGSDLAADVALTDLSALGGSYRGGVTAAARLTGTLQAGTLSLSGQGRDLAIGQAQADRLLRGTSDVAVDLTLRQGKIDVTKALLGNPQLRVSATGSLAGSANRVTLDARLNDLGTVLPEFPGPLTVTGSVVDDLRNLTLDLRGRGPGQIDAALKGRLSRDLSQADVTLTGSAQAALANPFLDPRAISGPLRFDLRLNGPLAARSLTGTVNLAGGRFTDPGLVLALEGVQATARLAAGRAEISAEAGVPAGGRVRAGGSVGLDAPFPGDLRLTLDRVVVRDPELYRTRANGEITVKGPLLGGAAIAGRIVLLETELRVPSSGLGASGDIPPDMRHLAEPRPVFETRRRAGLVSAEGRPGRTASQPYALDLVISAPNQLFVRGRGLDAELGGEITLRGSTVAVVPSGGFELIRGRLDILGKRLNLSEARLELEGDFDPFLDVVASTDNNGVTSSVRIEGPATDPRVSFTSSPQLPEEEVLAQLLFGQDLTSLSAFQAARLAGAVANLAGRGGAGLMDRLRGGLNLDDFDVTTTEDGNTAVTAGKYIAKNTYTELSVDDQGNSEIHLNYDVSPSVTVRARSSSDGDTGIGVFLERDY